MLQLFFLTVVEQYPLWVSSIPTYNKNVLIHSCFFDFLKALLSFRRGWLNYLMEFLPKNLGGSFITFFIFNHYLFLSRFLCKVCARTILFRHIFWIFAEIFDIFLWRIRCIIFFFLFNDNLLSCSHILILDFVRLLIMVLNSCYILILLRHGSFGFVGFYLFPIKWFMIWNLLLAELYLIQTR